MSIRLLVSIVLASISGCCLAPMPMPTPAPAPAPVPWPSAGPTLPDPVAPPSIDLPLAPPPLAVAAPDPFDLDAIHAAQLRNLRALFDAAHPIEGSLAHTVLVCSTIVRGSGYDDSFFAGGPDVALQMRLGTGPVRGTPQSPQRIYSMPVGALASGDTVWIRVVDQDVFFDDTIAEGSTRYERAPFTLTMGQADVECRAVDPARVERGATQALDELSHAVAQLPQSTPDLTAADLGYPSASVASVTAAAQDVAAWTGPSDARLLDALEPAHTWAREWGRRVDRALSDASSSLPAPGTVVRDGASEISITQIACAADAMALRADIGDAASPAASTSGCLALLHFDHAAPRTIAHDRSSPSVWALDAEGRRIGIAIDAVRVDGTWQSLDRRPRASGSYDVALALENGDAHLLRVGAPFAHAQLLRLQ